MTKTIALLQIGGTPSNSTSICMLSASSTSTETFLGNLVEALISTKHLAYSILSVFQVALSINKGFPAKFVI